VDSQRRKSNVALLSVVSNAMLVTLKLAVGLLIGSVAVLSEAIHSGLDLVASLIAFFAIKQSGKPADADHPYGHGKIENLSGAVEAVLIFVAAAWIVVEAMRKLLHPVPIETLGLGVAVMGVSALANTFVSHRLFKVGHETESVALQADAWHLRTDVYTSLGVFAGLALIAISERLVPGTHFHWIDPIAAILVALLIVRAAWRLTVQSLRDLIDQSMPEAEQDEIRRALTTFRPEMYGFHRLRTRKAGATRFIDFHMLVAPKMHVDASHALADRVTAKILERFPRAHVIVHIEPCEGDCDPTCITGCLRDEAARAAVRRGR
jgi:cation diffusion facilitator family transporter